MEICHPLLLKIFSFKTISILSCHNLGVNNRIIPPAQRIPNNNRIVLRRFIKIKLFLNNTKLHVTSSKNKKSVLTRTLFFFESLGLIHNFKICILYFTISLFCFCFRGLICLCFRLGSIFFIF